MKRLFFLLILAVYVLSGGGLAFAAQETPGAASAMQEALGAALADASSTDAASASDVVLLVDVSGSMSITDVDRAMPDSVNGLIDRIAADGGRVGIVTFSGTLKYILPISDLSDAEERERVKLRISRSVYNGYTDIGQVLLKSTELLSEQAALNNPMVLLFTDGMIEINPNTTRRTAEQSYSDALTAIDTLDGQAAVYAVGLNEGDRVDRALLSTITGGDAGRVLIAEDAAQLPDLFQAAYDSHKVAEEPAASEGTLPSEEPNSGEETLPGEDTASSEEAIPGEDTASSEEAIPGEDTASSEATLPGEDTASSEETIPSEDTASSEATLPGEEPDSSEEILPGTEPASSEEPSASEEPTASDEPESNEASTSGEEPSQSEQPTYEPWRPGPAILIALVVLVLAAVGISARWLLRLAKGGANARAETGSISFDITISAPLGGEKVPTVSVEAEIGGDGLALSELVEAAINKQSRLNVDTDGLNILTKRKSGQTALILEGKAKCEISDSSNTILEQKKIRWKENERLTFIDPDMTKLEITYVKE